MSLDAIKHHKVGSIHGCADPQPKLWPAHEKRGLSKPPKPRAYTKLVHSGMGARLEPQWNNIKADISDYAFWAARFVSKDVDIRVGHLIGEIQKVNDLAEGNLGIFREHINQLGPKLAKAIGKIPTTVLQSEEFLKALQEIKENHDETKKLKLELITTKEELADLKAQFADLKKLVEQIQNN